MVKYDQSYLQNTMNMLTLHEVAKAMKVSESTVRRWVRAGALIAYKVGQRGQLRIREEDLEEYLESRVVKVGKQDVERHDTATHGKGVAE